MRALGSAACAVRQVATGSSAGWAKAGTAPVAAIARAMVKRVFFMGFLEGSQHLMRRARFRLLACHAAGVARLQRHARNDMLFVSFCLQ